MNYPTDPLAQQRHLAFKNVSRERIPGFAIIGPQEDTGGEIDAILSDDNIDYALRLGRASAVATSGQDAGLFYINGPQPVEPKSAGKCYQAGMMQALIGYDEDSPPAWGDGLSIDTSQTSTPFYLVPGGGAYKFIDFDGCPKTTFKDSQRTGYKFRVGWIVPASQSTALDGVIIKDNGTLATLEAGDILPLSGRDNPTLATFGLSDSLSTTTEATSLRTRGFYRVNTTGNYLFNFTARIRSTDSDINVNVSGNLKLYCRTNRIGNSDEFYTADQIESTTGDGSLDGDDFAFHNLRVGAEDQPADTNLVEGEVTEKHRHWQTVSGSTVLSMTEGELLFIYNPTGYELEVSGVSGTLVLLSGAASGGSSSTASTSSSDSSGGSSGGASSDEVAALDSRVTSVESDVSTIETDLGTLEATVTSQGTTITSHTASIATNASGISSNASDISGHETRITDLESFETSATASIASNASAISGNSDNIATNAAAIAANAGDIDDLEAFQTTATADIATNASDIDALETFQATTEGIFSAAITDGTYTTAAGDELTFSSGVLTSFTQGPVEITSFTGSSGQFLQSNGDGTTTWADAIWEYWEEGLTGFLLPKTTNVTDIGSTSRKVRDIHVGRNLIVGGTGTFTGAVSVQGLDVISNFLALGSDIDDLQAIVGKYIDGLIVTTTSSTATIASGDAVAANDASHLIEYAGGTADITSSGDRVSGESAPSAAGENWYLLLVETSGGSEDVLWSTSNSLPSGFSYYRLLAAYTTTTSGALRVSHMQPDRKIKVQFDAVIYTSTSYPSSPTLVSVACPPGSYVDGILVSLTATNGCIMNVLRGTAPSGDTSSSANMHLAVGVRRHYGAKASSPAFSGTPFKDVETDGSGRVYTQVFVTSPASTVPTAGYLIISGYKVPD